jgi:O-antigen ligase
MEGASTTDSSTAPVLRVGRPFELRLPSGGAAWWLLVVAVVVATARLTMVSLQAGCTAALVVLTVGMYAWNRTAGLVAVWLTWLLAPFARRVFFLSEPLETEPLALAPFLITALVAALELQRTNLSPSLRRVLLLVTGGYLLGAYTGLRASPPAAAFALLAYLTAAGCLVIGYREGSAGRRLVLPAVLMVVAPILSLYAFGQYYLDLPEWDAAWRENAEVGTVGSPDGDRIRVWSTLNSPGTFAYVLGLTLVAYIALRPFSVPRVLAALPVLGALALTYVRGAWIATILAVLALGILTRGAALGRAGAVALVVAAIASTALGGATGSALTERVSSLSDPAKDESGEARLTTAIETAPVAAAQPLGLGVGQAGEATRLGERGGFRYTDNGYLALLFQVGPFGFLLVMAGVVIATRRALRNAWRRPRDSVDVLAAGLVVLSLLAMLGGDQLYGVGGMIFWYAAGLAMRRGDEPEDVSP